MSIMLTVSAKQDAMPLAFLSIFPWLSILWQLDKVPKSWKVILNI
jgi:hypothetical protein